MTTQQMETVTTVYRFNGVSPSSLPASAVQQGFANYLNLPNAQINVEVIGGQRVRRAVGDVANVSVTAHVPLNQVDATAASMRDNAAVYAAVAREVPDLLSVGLVSQSSSASQSNSQSSSSSGDSTMAIAIGAAVGGGVLLVLIVAVILYRRKQSNKPAPHNDSGVISNPMYGNNANAAYGQYAAYDAMDVYSTPNALPLYANNTNNTNNSPLYDHGSSSENAYSSDPTYSLGSGGDYEVMPTPSGGYTIVQGHEYQPGVQGDVAV